MAKIHITSFDGMIPALDNTQLPDTAASNSCNTWLYSGSLTGLPELTTVATLTDADAQKVFRLPNDYSTAGSLVSGQTGAFDSIWLEFQQPDTDVVRAPIVDDSFDRYYWCSPTLQPTYNTRARIAAGSGNYLLGLPAPGAGMTVTPDASGSGAADTRSYLYTWETLYGEEGPPSDPVTATGLVDDQWDLASIVAAAANDQDGPDRDIDFINIYRTVTSGTNTTYFFVAQIAVTATTYADTDTDLTISANNQLESTGWIAPPTDLEGMLHMANGILAGWKDNEVWFSEPYRPHAWPAAYAQVVEFPVIGLGVSNQTLVICSQGHPVTASGIHPNAITSSKLTSFEPCTSRGSIVSAPEGVFYTSPNGLVRVTPGAAENITRKLITKDRWQTLTRLTGLRAVRFGTSYYAFGTINPQVFENTAFEADGAATAPFEEEDFTGALLGVLIDTDTPRVGFNLLSSDDVTVNVISDVWSGETLIIREGDIFYINQAELVPTVSKYTWKSKRFMTKDDHNFGAMKVYFDTVSTTPTLNATRNTDQDQVLAADQYGVIKVYADGVVKMVRELRTSGELWRIPSGFKADFWEVEIIARVKITSMQIGSSVKELANV